MKFLSLGLLIGLVISPLTYADCGDASKQAALDFMNSYVNLFDDEEVDSDKWIAENKQLTSSFKDAYKKLVEDALKADPELGLDSDPIIDGQDSAEQFDKVTKCDEKSGVLLVSGPWDEEDTNVRMEVAVKPVKDKDQWLIDGAGIINIPKEAQAPRESGEEAE